MNGIHGATVLLLVEVPSKPGHDSVTIRSHNLEVMNAVLMDQQIPKFKTAMKIFVQVNMINHHYIFHYNEIFWIHMMKHWFYLNNGYIFIVDGGFGEWEEWGPCTQHCGGGDQTRTRRCDNPIPQFGGWKCFGAFTECQRCNLDPCPSTCPA